METAMVPIAGVRKMAKKPPRNDKQTKIDADVLRNIQLVCTYRGVQIAEYISEHLRPIAARDLAEEQARATKPPAKGKGGAK